MNLQQMDSEIERLSKLHQETWHRILELQSLRSFELARLASAAVQTAPAVQQSQWNDYGFNPNDFAETT